MQEQFIREIKDFILDSGAACNEIKVHGTVFLRAVSENHGARHELCILPAAVTAVTEEEAIAEYRRRTDAVKILEAETVGRGDIPEECRYGSAPGIVTLAEDRWRSQSELYRTRLQAHLGKFRSIFARKCNAVRTDRTTANAFLSENHNYGAASSRYCYVLEENGKTVAAATFSNARKWTKNGIMIRSYEWVRYASLKGTRVTGGMGKLLSAFVRDIGPDDIMSYADLEWSDGAVYRKLGFMEDGTKDPVLFLIDPENWSRTPAKSMKRQTDPSVPGGQEPFPENTEDGTGNSSGPSSSRLWYMNCGSIKYRLKLTDY